MEPQMRKDLMATAALFVVVTCLLVVMHGCQGPKPPVDPPDPPPTKPDPKPGVDYLDEQGNYKDEDKQELWRLHAMERAGLSGNPELSKVTPHEKLNRAAQKHADWMAENNIMDHRGENGSSFWDRVKAEDYLGFGGGENIASGQPTPGRAFLAWKNSPGHMRNIRGPKWEHIGIGHAKAKNDRIFWCVVFAYGGNDFVAREGREPLELWLPEPIEEPLTSGVDSRPRRVELFGDKDGKATPQEGAAGR